MSPWAWRLVTVPWLIVNTAVVVWFASATATWHRLPVVILLLTWVIGGGVIAGLCLIQALRVERRRSPLRPAIEELHRHIAEHMRSYR
jgi:uncharacterized integral membrane protein